MRMRVLLIGVLSTALLAITIAVSLLQRDIEPEFDHPEVAVNIYGQDPQTGRILLGGTVQSDLGLAGQVIEAAGTGMR